MAARLRQLLLSAALSDGDAVADAQGWRSRCLHCRSPVGVYADGTAWGGTTLEHIVPRAWFAKPGARVLCAGLDGPDDPRNLALACARCNHGKGRGADARGPGDARALEIVGRLLARRLQRWVLRAS